MRKVVNVLVVDDDLGICETMNDVLSEHHHVDIARDGFEGLRMTKDHDIDIVLMDMKMPGMDGIETSKKIKVVHPMMKIIMITAFLSEIDRDRAMNVGIEQILCKPIDFGTLEPLLVK